MSARRELNGGRRDQRRPTIGGRAGVWMALGLVGGLTAGLSLASFWAATASPAEPVATGTTLGESPLAPPAGPRPSVMKVVAPTEGLYSMIDTQWAASSLWDDGNAELNLYGGKLHREFALREDAYAAHVVVKEAFTPEYLVKANDWRAPGNFDVLKLNYITHVRTGLYDWDEMVSAFVARDGLVPVKMTYGRQEWCGNVFKEWRRWGNERHLLVSSYFDGTGTQRIEHGLGDEVVPHDSLPLLLRALRFDRLSAGEKLSFPLLPPLLGAGAGPVEAVEATLTVGERTTLTVAAGSFETLWVGLTYPGRRDRTERQSYWIEIAAPNRIVQVEGPGDERLQLMRSERLQYWRMSDDDDAWFPAPAASDDVDRP